MLNIHKYPAEVRTVIKNELGKAIMKLDIFTVGQLTSVHYGVLFGVIEHALASMIRTRDQVYFEKKEKILEYSVRFPNSNTKEKITSLDEQCNKESLKKQLMEMSSKLRRKYLRIHSYYLKNNPESLEGIMRECLGNPKYSGIQLDPYILKKGLEFLRDEADDKVTVNSIFVLDKFYFLV